MRNFSVFLLFFVFTSSLFSKEILPANKIFHVFRNNEKIGSHKLFFSSYKDSNGSEFLDLKIEINFDVKFLGFSVYKYSHINKEKWRKIQKDKLKEYCNDCKKIFLLEELNSLTDKNGDRLSCEIKKISSNNKSFNLINKKDNIIFNHLSLSTSYWNKQLVNGNGFNNKIPKNLTSNSFKRTVINSQDCQKLNLNISFLGKKKIYNKKTEAFHYKLLGNESNGGDVDIDIWYENDEWIKMVFKKDGSKIEYFLDEYHGE